MSPRAVKVAWFGYIVHQSISKDREYYLSQRLLDGTGDRCLSILSLKSQPLNFYFLAIPFFHGFCRTD
jgi:hypothetical protein